MNLSEHQLEVAARELCRMFGYSKKYMPLMRTRIDSFLRDHEDMLAALAAGQRAEREPLP